MHTRELGLLLAHQLLSVDDLHYGLWEADLPVTLTNLRVAQQRYTDLLLERIGRQTAGISAARILDVGCGTGHMVQRLRERGFRVDAVNPSAALNEIVRERLQAIGDDSTVLLETAFESIPDHWMANQYDLILFSESFQYIPIAEMFGRLSGLLAAGGQVVICDFFKTVPCGPNGAGDPGIGGGHDLEDFYRRARQAGFAIELDEDLTARVSPSIALLDDWMRNRFAPATATVNTWLLGQYPFTTRLLKWLLYRKLARIQTKYMSGNRSQAMFERTKSYRLFVLRVPGR